MNLRFCLVSGILICLTFSLVKNELLLWLPKSANFLQTSAYLDLQFLEIRQLSDSKWMDATGLKIKKINKTRKLFGPIIYNVDFDNTYTVQFLAMKKQGGQYQMMPYQLMQQGFCDFFHSPINKPFVDELFDATDLPNPLPCPFGNVSKKFQWMTTPQSFQMVYRQLLTLMAFTLQWNKFRKSFCNQATTQGICSLGWTTVKSYFG